MSFYLYKKLLNKSYSMAITLQRPPYQKPLRKRNNKRASLIAAVSVCGSISLEAAIAVPIFFCFLLQILSSIQVINFQSDLEGAMYQTGKEMAMYGYTYENSQIEIPDVVFSLAYIPLKIKKEMKRDLDGVSFLSSKIMEEDRIDIVAEYKLKQQQPLLAFLEMPTFTRCTIRAFTGYDLEADAWGEEEKEQYVYITDKGSVYHENRNCGYLDLSVSEKSYQLIEAIRNKEGGKYYPCEICGKGMSESVVYITDYGNRYHFYLGCNKLKRTVKAILLSEARGRLGCKKCGGENG